MKPVAFDYVAAHSLEEALAALQQGGEDAKPIAGGQSLVPALNMRLVRPTLLVDLNRAGPRRDRGERRRPDRRHRPPGGARARPAHPSAAARGASPRRPLRDAEPRHGRRQRRPRRRAAEIPLCLAALGGTVVVEGPTGRREIAPADFFVTHYLTTLAPGELVVATTWPLAGGRTRASPSRSSRCGPGDYGLAMVAVVLRRVDGVAREVRVVGRRRDRPADRARRGRARGRSGAPLTEASAREAGLLAAAAVDPPGSIHASAAYLRHLTGTLVERTRSRSPAARASSPRSTCASCAPRCSSTSTAPGSTAIEGTAVRIGATVRQATLEHDPRAASAPARGASLRRPLRHPQPRHRRRQRRPRRRRRRDPALPRRPRRHGRRRGPERAAGDRAATTSSSRTT